MGRKKNKPTTTTTTTTTTRSLEFQNSPLRSQGAFAPVLHINETVSVRLGFALFCFDSDSSNQQRADVVGMFAQPVTTAIAANYFLVSQPAHLAGVCARVLSFVFCVCLWSFCLCSCFVCFAFGGGLDSVPPRLVTARVF